MSNNTYIRDNLALERTRLANERTFLAYVRTGLSLLAGSVILLQFFTSLNAHIIIAGVLAGCGFIVLLIGIIRFNKVRIKLNKAT